MPEKRKFSWNALALFAQHAAIYIDSKKGIETKFTYALRRVLPQIGAHEGKVQEALADIEIDNCVTETRNGSEGVIVRDEKGALVFTAPGAKLRNKQKTEHLTKPEYEIEPYFARCELPGDLTVDQVLAFVGLVIDAANADQVLAAIEDRALDDAATAAAEPASD